jgi:hypothetical protein
MRIEFENGSNAAHLRNNKWVVIKKIAFMTLAYMAVRLAFYLFLLIPGVNSSPILVLILKCLKPFLLIFTLSAAELSLRLDDHSFLGFASFLLDVGEIVAKLEVKDMIRCLQGREDIGSFEEDATPVQPPKADLPVVNAALQWVPLVVISLSVLAVIFLYSAQY